MGNMSPHMKIKKGRPLANWPGGNTPPVINITNFEANPDVSGNPFTSEYVAVATDNEQGDISANIVWSIASAIATQGIQGVDLGGVPGGGASSGLTADTAGVATASIAGSPAGTVVPGVATQNWDVDVTIDGGGLQQLVVAVNIADDYDDITALLDAQLAGGVFTFVGGDFVVTSDTTGVSSTVVVAAGTDGTGDLFAAITAAAGGNPAITFPAPADGTTTVYTGSVDIDGAEAAQPISIVGEDAQTFQDVLDELNADTTGAVWTLAGNGLVCTSDSTGVTSSVNLIDSGIFAALTGFSSVEAAANGTDQVDAVGGSGGTPSLTFLVTGVQVLEASITDGFGSTVVDTETITVTSF